MTEHIRILEEAAGRGTENDGTTAANDEPEIMSFDEASRRFDGEHILMKITAYDDRHWPAAGKIIAHDCSREELYRLLAQLPSTPDGRRFPYYIFEGAPRARTGEERRRLMEELIRQYDDAEA